LSSNQSIDHKIYPSWTADILQTNFSFKKNVGKCLRKPGWL